MCGGGRKSGGVALGAIDYYYYYYYYRLWHGIVPYASATQARLFCWNFPGLLPHAFRPFTDCGWPTRAASPAAKQQQKGSKRREMYGEAPPGTLLFVRIATQRNPSNTRLQAPTGLIYDPIESASEKKKKPKEVIVNRTRNTQTPKNSPTISPLLPSKVCSLVAPFSLPFLVFLILFFPFFALYSFFACPSQAGKVYVPAMSRSRVDQG
jgi:hypothetical protein